jgi:hypothetical protein
LMRPLGYEQILGRPRRIDMAHCVPVYRRHGLLLSHPCRSVASSIEASLLHIWLQHEARELLKHSAASPQVFQPSRAVPDDLRGRGEAREGSD